MSWPQAGAIRQGDVFNTAELANTDWLATVVTFPRTCIARITVCSDTAGVVTARLTRAGTTVSLQFNAGSNLAANAVYTFDLPVKAGDQLNLRIGVGATILLASIDEIDVMGV